MLVSNCEKAEFNSFEEMDNNLEAIGLGYGKTVENFRASNNEICLGIAV